MVLIIGGYAQGKLACAMKKYKLVEPAILDGALPEADAVAISLAGDAITGEMLSGEAFCISHFNAWARRQYEAGSDRAAVWSQLQKCEHVCQSRNCQLILLSTEIGNGIVPIDAGDRGFREWMGRLQVQIAAEADEVIRICCGIPQRLK